MRTAERTFRPRVSSMLVSWGVALWMGGFAVSMPSWFILTINRAGLSGGLVVNFVWLEVAFISGAWMLARLARTHIILREDGVTLVNVLRTRHLPWYEIERFDVGASSWGIGVHLKDGPPVTANAVQKSNLMRWLNRRARADGVVDELNAALRSRRGSDH